MENMQNYLLPFMWIRDGEHDQLVHHIDTIQKMGHQALCVESRPHQNFCKEEWWDDMALILAECKKRDMKVWLLDDKFFPTGYANGSVANHPECKSRVLIERSLDVVGPVKETYFQVMYRHPSDKLVGVCAYPRTEKGHEVTGKPINLMDKVKGNRVYTDLPEGIWRIVYFISTEQFVKENYINMVDEKSCELMISEIYEPHYERFKEYFGTTFVGFFSDEPAFKNDYYENKLLKGNVYDRRIGDVGLALPFSEELLQMLTEELGENPVPYFYGLWYELQGETERIRHCYMDCATKLYQKNFSRKLGEWSRAHGVDYIGHVIEDNDCHARMTYGAGHYFRAISGQSMGGIDIVLHQVVPGFADHSQIISCGKLGNTEFFHYGLGKLASSISHIYPHMKNRAMCEVFGAYGWAESTPLMKWLVDYLFVRGINHFVPHAFSLREFDIDSPPHFNCKGYPQSKGYRKLADYMNRMSNALYRGEHVCDAAILYHAELEWWNYDCMCCETPGKQLYDNLMDYDFVDIDSLKEAKVAEGKLILNKEAYPCLIVPEAKDYPPMLKAILNRLAGEGLDIICVNSCPEGVKGRVVALADLAEDMQAKGYKHISAEAEGGHLRFYHLDCEEGQLYMFFNEAVTEESTLRLFVDGAATHGSAVTCGEEATCDGVMAQANGKKTVSLLDLLEEKYETLPQKDGVVTLTFGPYESKLVFVGEDQGFAVREETSINKEEIGGAWNISLYDTVEEKVVKEYENVTKLFNLNGYEACPEFAGEATYRTTFTVNNPKKKTYIKVYADGQTVEMKVNGKDAGLQICYPFVFDVTGLVQEGDNELEITLCNTLANKIEERYTAFLPVYAGGMIREPELLEEK